MAMRGFPPWSQARIQELESERATLGTGKIMGDSPWNRKVNGKFIECDRKVQELECDLSLHHMIHMISEDVRTENG